MGKVIVPLTISPKWSKSDKHDQMLKTLGMKMDSPGYVIEPITFSLSPGLDPVDVVVRIDIECVDRNATVGQEGRDD